MKKVFTIVVIAVSGCVHTDATPTTPPTIKIGTFSQFHLESFQWNNVARVLVLPLLNESDYTRANEEIGRALQTGIAVFGPV